MVMNSSFPSSAAPIVANTITTAIGWLAIAPRWPPARATVMQTANEPNTMMPMPFDRNGASGPEKTKAAFNVS